MRAIRAVTCAAMLFTASVAVAQAVPDATWWNGLKPTEKGIYLQGYSEGSDFANHFWSGFQATSPNKLSPETLTKAQKLTSYKGISLAQLQTGIDAFYRDPGDTHIPVTDAVFVVKYRLGGGDPGFLEQYIAALRRKTVQPAK